MIVQRYKALTDTSRASLTSYTIHQLSSGGFSAGFSRKYPPSRVRSGPSLPASTTMVPGLTLHTSPMLSDAPCTGVTFSAAPSSGVTFMAAALVGVTFRMAPSTGVTFNVRHPIAYFSLRVPRTYFAVSLRTPPLALASGIWAVAVTTS